MVKQDWCGFICIGAFYTVYSPAWKDWGTLIEEYIDKQINIFQPKKIIKKISNIKLEVNYTKYKDFANLFKNMNNCQINSVLYIYEVKELMTLCT